MVKNRKASGTRFVAAACVRTTAGRSTHASVLALAGALLVASSVVLPACADGAVTASDGITPDVNEAHDAAPTAPVRTTADASSEPADAGEPPPPPCDGAQTAAIQASFADVSKIPDAIGAVAMIKDPSCGVRYFTRGASKDVPQTALHYIGSATKTYVASVILTLVDEGKISLTDSVTKWVPTAPGGDAVKIQHLLNHTSGIYNYSGDAFWMLSAALFHTKYTPQALVDVAAAKGPVFAPGAAGKWDYSNTNYVLLGMIIESVTGKDLAAVIRERILTPIGANATFFNGTEPLVGDVAYGQSFLNSNGATAWDPSATWGCGNIAATIGDLVNWEERRGNGTFHSPAMQAVLTNGVATGADYTYGAALVMVNATDPVLHGNGPAMGHGGDTIGYHTLAYYFPDKKATISVIVDSDKGPTSSFPFGATYLSDVYLTLIDPYFGTTTPGADAGADAAP